MSFLGVDASATGRRWVGPGIETERQAEHLHQLTQLPLPLCKVLATRGVGADEAASFLDPTMKDLLPNPRGMKDMELAATRTLQAIDNQEKIAVFADYDVDGATSATLLIDWFRQMGREVTLYIPDRIDEAMALMCPRWRPSLAHTV